MKCLHCNTKHNRAVGIDEPENGHVAICFKCGAWLVFEENGMREPTRAEFDRIEAHPGCQDALKTWMALRAG
jgi:transcription elongation factor Elf1